AVQCGQVYGERHDNVETRTGHAEPHRPVLRIGYRLRHTAGEAEAGLRTVRETERIRARHRPGAVHLQTDCGEVGRQDMDRFAVHPRRPFCVYPPAGFMKQMSYMINQRYMKKLTCCF